MKKSVHFIGIGGIGMSGLAKLLLSQGYRVSGSDIRNSPIIEDLRQRGATIFIGHAQENLSVEATVVFSSDIAADNPELQAAHKWNCPLLHRSDLLAQLIEGKLSLAVAGTHGKTTVSALLTTVLSASGKDPSFAVGGILPSFKGNAQAGAGDYFVLEADESDGSFLKYHPFGAIVTNIDNDHLVNYGGDFNTLVSAFKQFMQQVNSSDHLFWCLDDASLAALQARGVTYGFHPESQWRILTVEQKADRLFFDLQHNGQIFADIELALIGRHNALNGAAVFAMATALGVLEEDIRRSFRLFQGVLRRCEMKGSCEGVLFLDDYAHHPTEIKTTLEGIRKSRPDGRLIAVFQPHRYSRTQDCLGLYGNIFNAADAVFVTEIYSAGEKQIPGVDAALICAEIKAASLVPCTLASRDSLSALISAYVRPADVVVTLGAGDVTKVSQEVLSLMRGSKA